MIMLRYPSRWQLEPGWFGGKAGRLYSHLCSWPSVSPRLYAEVHFLTDLLAGGALALGSLARCTLHGAIHQVVFRGAVLPWEERHTATFYTIGSLLLFQSATLFWDICTALSRLGISV